MNQLPIFVFPLLVGVILQMAKSSDDPCDTTNYIDEWQRSVAFGGESPSICDNFLAKGWYRVISGAGELMPEECPAGGFRCNTDKPIYLGTDDLPDGENAYPAVGETVDRTAYAANWDGNCKYASYDIRIKNCDGYFVYYLQPISGGCSSAYCFGDQLPCENGTRSENGFSPGCETFPDVEVTPYVKPDLMETEGVNEFGIEMVYSRATFECHADDLQNQYTYITRWYVNDIEMNEAKLEGLSKTDLDNGLGRMLEEHWKFTFKPNMLVKCAIQVSGADFGTAGPQHYSGNFFAGIKINQSLTSDFVVLEGEELRIPVELTMPLSCSWPKTAETTKKGSDTLKNYIRKEVCLLVLLNGIPEYQKNEDQCVNGISEDGVIFNAETCGIKFSHANWQEKQEVVITGQSDQMVNIKDRIAFLRLYNSDEVTPIEDILYWKNIHLPDIKVLVQDTDVATLGSSCHSNNDPHMRTFDGKYWELQIYNGLTEGEYIMYKHDRLPLQISAYFKMCYGTVLCNCGIAVRSGDSVFVANYCTTTFRGERKVNRYMIQRLCDDQSLIITKTSSSYTITLPTGTKVTFNYGSGWIDGINIIPSILDAKLTKGLCGIYNGNVNDDLTPRNQLVATTSEKTFAEAWQVKGIYADETLFHPDGVLKETEYFGQQYCSCVAPDDDYPHGSPKFNCELTSAMETCRNERTTAGVFPAKCASTALNKKKKRDTSDNELADEQPPAFPMVAENTSPEMVPETWRNGWTEESAREHCTFKFENAAAFNICNEYVPYVDTSTYIFGCIADIKSTGGDSWLKVTLRNYASACLQESKRLEILTVTNSTNSTGTEKPIRSIIEESTCPDNCSNNGICVDGECQCNEGFYGELCSVTPSQAPVVIKDAFNGLCDTSKKPCQTFVIPGSDFIEGRLICKYTAFSLKNNGTMTKLEEGDTFTYTGTYSSSLLMLCKLPPSRRKRSVEFDVIATGYYISISNNNQNFTETLTTIIYDSMCYECNTTSMSCIQQETCPIHETETPKEANKSFKLIAIGIAAVVVVFICVVAALFLRNKCRTKKPYIRDSTLSLPNTSRQMPPKQHFVNNDAVFLSEKIRSNSDLDSHKTGW